MQLFVALQHALNRTRGVVVLFTNNARIENPGRGVQGIHSRVNAQLSNLTRQHGGGVQVGEGRRRCRVGQVICRHVNRLHRGNRPLGGRRDALLQNTHLGGQCRLVADRRRHAAKQRGHFRTGLGKPEDVIDKQQHVLAFFLAEILGHGQPGQPHAQPRPRRLSHLAINQGRFVDNARLFHFQPQVIALASALTHAGKHGIATVLTRDVTNQLHDNDGLAYASATEEPCLAAPGVGLQQVDDLNARLQHLRARTLLLQQRCVPVDGITLLRGYLTQTIHRLTNHVENPAQHLRPHRHGNRLAGIFDINPPNQAIGRLHGDRAHGGFAQMLSDFTGNGFTIRDRYLEGIIDGG